MPFTAEERRERNRLAVRRWRARESPDAKAERLRQQRERRRQSTQRFRDRATLTATEERLRRDRERHERARAPERPVPEPEQPTEAARHRVWGESDIPRLQPVSADAKRECLERLQLALGAAGLDGITCAVCDSFKLATSCRVIKATDSNRVRLLRELLSSATEALPAELIAEYDCSSRSPALAGLLLSKRGVHADGRIDVCTDCDKSLAKHVIPKFAIKNGFAIGTLPPRVADATLPERLITQPVSVIAVTRVMRGGAHRSIRSHCLAFDCTPGPAATLLPIQPDCISTYRVVMAGPFTSEQQARVRKMHRIRRQVVDDLLRFYKQHNPLYASVSIADSSHLSTDSVAENVIFEDPDANAEVGDIDAENDRVGGVSENDADAAESDIVERRVVFVSDDCEVTTQHARVATSPSVKPQFLVRHSTQFATKDKDLYARMFPHLFPYGRGHPGDERHVHVSRDSCIRHYSQLSSRRFAEDELFMVASFDHLSVEKLFTNVAVKCQRDPARFASYSDVTEHTLLNALQTKERRRQGRIAFPRGSASDSASTTATDMLNTVELSGSTMWGSDAERAQCRRQAFAYQARFGQPALFVTLTPNIADSFVMAQYCGISSVDTLIDAALAERPDKAALYSASMRNDPASARLFVQNIEAFIEHVLGVSPKHMKAKPFDGLFGPVVAYFGMVETQGGGTLHAHFLVWLADAPPNSEAFDRAVATHGDQYYRDLEVFTNSIVTTSMPLSVTDSSCCFCGHSNADLQELPIPPEAYEDPKKQHGGRPRGEPELLRCSGCGKNLSSQHVIRRVLLDSRPAAWPPLMRPYSSRELKDAVRVEARRRGSVAAANAAVYRRDVYLTARESDAAGRDEHGEYLRGLNRAQFRVEHREDDAFRQDHVARALMTLPPSPDDARWPARCIAFAVSMLVFMLNLHWWSHAGSCFKKSSAAAPGQCRYNFPRARVARTSCSSDGVTLARRAPFEFVNGFNTEMMLAFKSNHDIQVMIGGLAALLRIFYATKYVTKMQEHIDSITAVALAAFRRRQLREARDEEAVANTDRATIGRRRVASLLYAITNRREIAGPLAALYVQRGSCAFMSTPCATFHLRAILHELIDQDAHSCDLVELRGCDSSVTFRAASFLDDYSYRPPGLD